MTDNKAIEVANKIQLSSNPLWVEIKRLACDYEKQIKELEKQIEKMKCGQNCKHSYLYQEDRKCKFTYCDCINCKDKWVLRS